ncbi:MAG: cytochrome c nitrite reductase small subunit [Ignavibacteria bacterium]|jgi:cytochrome c nitrite reductase small subunit
MAKLYLLLSICIGITAGIGFSTFYYAKGYSYLSDNPAACDNCHIMNDEYFSWVKSSHHYAATCNDCHTPKDFAGKWLIKGLNGWNHSYAFTSGDYHKPIQINERNKNITEENCRYCHKMMAYNLTFHETENNKIECTSCHRNVGHLK